MSEHFHPQHSGPIFPVAIWPYFGTYCDIIVTVFCTISPLVQICCEYKTFKSQKICSFRFPLTVLPSINLRSILTIVFSYDAPKLWNDLPYDIRSAPKSVQFQKSTQNLPISENHSHHSFLLPNTGRPLWERLGTCLMSYDLCLMNWMVCLRIR